MPTFRPISPRGIEGLIYGRHSAAISRPTSNEIAVVPPDVCGRAKSRLGPGDDRETPFWGKDIMGKQRGATRDQRHVDGNRAAAGSNSRAAGRGVNFSELSNPGERLTK